MKKFLILLLVLLPFAFLYSFLEKHVGDNWWSVGIFFVVLVSARLAYELYRRRRKSGGERL